MIDACPVPTGVARPSAQVTGAFSNGGAIVLTGSELTTDDCYDYDGGPRPADGAVWHSSDGRHWGRAVTPTSDFLWLESWGVNDGWEAVVLEPSNPRRPRDGHKYIWRSDDGLFWDRAEEVDLDFVYELRFGVSYDDTRLLLNPFPPSGHSSIDGTTWVDVDIPFDIPDLEELSDWSLLRRSESRGLSGLRSSTDFRSSCTSRDSG